MNHDGEASHPDGAKLLSAESFGDRTFGLRHDALSPIETLAQSISTVAPSTSPPITVPLVFALAAQGTALAYAVAMVLMVLIGLCIAAFARESSSPGSLYAYTRRSLPPLASSVTAWALFFAYVTTASAVIGGFVKFAYTVLDYLPHAFTHVPAALIVLIAAAAATWIAYRDIRLSARLMLYIETASVVFIAVVIAATLFRHGLHLDRPQLSLRGMNGRGIGLGGMLAVFSFVGFESATTLGAEAKDPLRTIPRAVVRSALLSGVFFIVCGYGEVMAFRGSPVPLDRSAAPFHVLAALVHLAPLGVLIDVGVLISTFAATLSCIIAASRVLLLMSHHGLAHGGLRHTNATHETPGAATVLCGLLAALPAAALALHGTSGGDIYGWMGTLAVYGFLTAYGMVAVALFFHRVTPQGFCLPAPARVATEGVASARVAQGFSPGSHGVPKRWGALAPGERLRVLGTVLLTAAATLAILLAMASNLYPVPPAPLVYFPYIYVAYLAVALGWLALSKRRT